MKNISKYGLMAFLITAMVLVACTKEEDDVRLDPQLATISASEITSHSATITGFVVSAGAGFTERGVCYDVTEDPTTESSKVIFVDTSDNASFTVTVDSLDYATKYYARAYATGSEGTFYGDTVSFTTLPVVPTVSTTEITDIKGTSATGGGNVTVTGGAPITAKGVCYSTSEEPTINDMKTDDGPGEGEFVSSITGLEGTTTYYVRAYATNAAGTAYGEQVSFTTDIAQLTWYIPGSYVAVSYPGSGLEDWNPEKSPYIKSSLADPNNLEGYIYMANASNEWKVATGTTWDETNYGGADGSLSTDGGNIVSQKGYYKLNVDAVNLTYTLDSTNWGVIGDATDGGWDTDANLKYYPEAQTWRGGVHLAASGTFKFRANDAWDINYGSTAADGKTLDAGGENIASPGIDADYAIELNLSTPLNYTYSANCWGIIGDATPTGWDSDTDMTWDEANGVFTVVITLTDGTVKFRANDDWTVNLGGDINAMTQDGDNITVTAGTYTVTLNPWDGIAVFSSAP